MGKTKDWMIEKALPPVLNQGVISPYGQVTDFKIDSDQRSAEVELALEGETQPVRILIQQFELIREGSDVFIQINAIQTSRAWLTQLARDYALGKKFRLPASAAKYVDLVL